MRLPLFLTYLSPLLANGLLRGRTPQSSWQRFSVRGGADAELTPQKAPVDVSLLRTLQECVGDTPLVRLQRMLPEDCGSVVLCKLEGNNPAGSVKDRAALSMISKALESGRIKPGDTLIEATSGNTGIALASIAAILGLKMKLIMPSNMSLERRASMAVYGAELILVSSGSMEEARDLAKQMEARGEGIVLDQFSNPDNPEAHFETTGPEVLRQTGGAITHFVTAMGTTGTAMGTSRYLKSVRPDVQVVGLQPGPGSQIPGIRRWPAEYMPSIFEKDRVDRVIDITQSEAEDVAIRLAREEGLWAGISSGGAVSAAMQVALEEPGRVVVCIICDRGDRYLSTGVFDPPAPTFHSTNPKDLDTALSAVLESGERAGAATFVAFTAAWCPDCQTAMPVMDELFAGALEGAQLLRCTVSKERDEWKSAEHPLRGDGRWALAGGDGLAAIPTLAHVAQDGSTTVLGGLEGLTEEEVRARVEAFVVKHGARLGK